MIDKQKIKVITSCGKEIEMNGIQEVEFTSTNDPEPEPMKFKRHQGSITGTVDQETVDQIVAECTPYNSTFRKIRMPDGKLLTRGKNK